MTALASAADLVDRVRGRLAGAGGPITSSVVADAVRAEAGGVVGHRDVLEALRLMRQEFVGAGPLEPLLRAPGTTDVLVSAPNEVWVDGADGLRHTEVTFPDEDSVRRLAQRLALACGRRLDDAQPYVDAWLPGTGALDRVRMHAVLPPLAPDGTCVSLRVLRRAAHDLGSLERLGTLDAATRRLLAAIVDARLAFLVTGGTGAGKTSLLSALLGRVAERERIVSVEDAGELAPAHPQFVRLVARPANVEGAGEVSLAVLVRQALRMRPDRLVVGEVRGQEVCDLLTALNTGHDGGAGTMHANSPAEVPARMEALAALGGLSRDALHSQLAAAFQVVLHMRRHRDGTRRLTEIGILDRTAGEVRVRSAWRDGAPSTGHPDLTDLLASRGIELPAPSGPQTNGGRSPRGAKTRAARGHRADAAPSEGTATGAGEPSGSLGAAGVRPACRAASGDHPKPPDPLVPQRVHPRSAGELDGVRAAERGGTASSTRDTEPDGSPGRAGIRAARRERTPATGRIGPPEPAPPVIGLAGGGSGSSW